MWTIPSDVDFVECDLPDVILDTSSRSSIKRTCGPLDAPSCSTFSTEPAVSPGVESAEAGSYRRERFPVRAPASPGLVFHWLPRLLLGAGAFDGPGPLRGVPGQVGFAGSGPR
jgi:hypothetical protein